RRGERYRSEPGGDQPQLAAVRRVGHYREHGADERRGAADVVPGHDAIPEPVAPAERADARAVDLARVVRHDLGRGDNPGRLVLLRRYGRIGSVRRPGDD